MFAVAAVDLAAAAAAAGTAAVSCPWRSHESSMASWLKTAGMEASFDKSKSDDENPGDGEREGKAEQVEAEEAAPAMRS